MKAVIDYELLGQSKIFECQIAGIFVYKCPDECSEEFDHACKGGLRQRQKSNGFSHLEFWRRTAAL